MTAKTALETFEQELLTRRVASRFMEAKAMYVAIMDEEDGGTKTASYPELAAFEQAVQHRRVGRV